METRFVPDAPGAWLVYDLGALVLAVPPELRAAGDAVAALPPAGVAGTIAALTSAGLGDDVPFAVLHAAAEGLHVGLRGPATVSVGAETLTGLGGDPWREGILTASPLARLTVPGGEWTLTPAASTVVAAPPAVAPPPPAAPVVPPAPLFDDSQELTEIPDLEISAVAPPALDPVASSIGEHDGGTVLVGDLPARPAEDKTVVVDEIARLRARRSGGLASPAIPVTLPERATKLSLELPDGTREPIDAVVVVGRAPSAPADAPASRLVRLGDGDISRNHARVAVEGDTVVVTDLGSRNGTIVRIPGRPPQKLRDGEPTPVLVGTVIDFGGGVELSVREG